MGEPLKILIAEDNPADAELTLRGLRKAGFDPEYAVVETEADFQREVARGVQIVFSDYSMPKLNALRALELNQAAAPGIPFIIISGTIGEETAVEAMKKGASDYLMKDRLGRLGDAVRTALEREQLRLMRRKEQADLLESERRFREMLVNLDLFAVMLDRRGIITFCNEALPRATGWEPKGVIGEDWFSKFVPPPGTERRRKFLEALEAGTIPSHAEHTVITRGGDLREVLWNNTLLRDADGRVIGVACVGEDVTDRRRAERGLRASEERFRQIAENIQEVFWMADSEMEQMLYVSPAYSKIWGRPTDSLYASPRTWIDAVHPDDREAVMLAAGTKRGLGTFDETYRIVRPDGTIRWIRDRGFPVRDDAGRIYRYVGTAEDITDRKKLHEQYLRAQRLESIGMLAAGIAHDLNNVLAPVLMATPMLREHVTGADDLEMLTTVERSAKRGAALVKQILGFAHGISGEPTPIQSKHLLNDVAAIIQETFPKSIQLETHIPKDLWIVNGNPTQIHQVLLNLCVNARDAMPAGGTLTLRGENRVLDELSSLAVEGARPGRWLVLQVEDNGSGIDPAILAHIWEPFYTTKTADKGTGLGLSTVRGIVETHRGFTVLSTQAGKGTRFSVYLPVSDGVPGSEQVAPPAPRGGGEFILVVDDEANIREMVKTIVSRHGYRVLAAVDGIEAISALAQQVGEIDLVVTDMVMPRLGGQQLIDVIRRLNPEAKVLAISGGAQDKDLTIGPSSHADAFLMKPFTADALLQEIHTLLNPARTGSEP
jgi:PAS domain S-box-containing protein